MKRTSFRGNTPPRSKQWTADELPGPRVPMQALRIPDGKARAIVSLPKENALQHQGYMNLVRAMKCAHCGKAPRSQFCHSDAGKGKGLKTDCRRGWPGCVDDLSRNREGCHTLIGSRGVYTKEQRRLLEDKYAAQTRAAILAAGTWPPRLPVWKEEAE